MEYCSYVLIVVGVSWLIGFAFCGFMLIRNHWVFKNRCKLIDSDFVAYKKLPSYDYMFYRFWIWDMKKFKQRELP